MKTKKILTILVLTLFLVMWTVEAALVDTTITYQGPFIDANKVQGLNNTKIPFPYHNHDERYFTKMELKSPRLAKVHWANLEVVPAGFADGKDNEGVTAIHTGIGLTGGGTSKVVTLELEVPLELSDSSYGGTIRGINTHQNGWGVYGHANYNGLATNYGGVFYAEGQKGRGVYGCANSTEEDAENYGGYFRTKGEKGRGVYGEAIAAGPFAINYGVYGKTNSEVGYAGFFVGGLNYFQGKVGIGTQLPKVELDVKGTTATDELVIHGGADIAEPFSISDSDKIPKGAVVVIDEESPGKLKLSSRPYDNCVAGVVSGAGGLNPGLTLSQKGVTNGGVNVALSGRVYALADASNGAIKPGDMLTTSSTPGHAMKATDRDQSNGAVIGKAMSSLEEGEGLVLVLVTLQ